MQKWQARFVEAQRLVTQWNINGFGGRKYVGVIEDTRSRVDLRRGDMKEQGKKLMAMLTVVISGLSNLEGRSFVTESVSSFHLVRSSVRTWVEGSETA